MEFGPSVKLTKRNHRALPILDYYLTFIHYFGFGINPGDDHSSRYLSIRVKRAPQKSIYERDQWLASYTRRTQRKLNSLPIPIFAYLKITLKYLAISLITFITVNHCFVLADYVYQGSRGIEEIILDVRLVITKLSALIFVLSWHHKRAEVRQLIKLVKSTSLYILATHGQQQRQQQPPNGLLLAADASPIPSPTPTTANAAAEAGNDESEATALTAAATSNLDGANGGKLTATISDEIGSSLRLDTRAFDRRILKGWLCCLLIIVVHFSLSEAEISKSHHLWQWLDDYSLHQLNNQSVSYETLMSLATFDNYIYTVHVYGTRLIGASIICIVCSLQHEVIKSLNLYTLRLIKRSKQPLLTSFGEPAAAAAAGCSGSRPLSAFGGPADDHLDEEGRRRRRRRHPSASSSRVSLVSEYDERPARPVASCGCRDAKSPLVDASAFFVLGESDWFRVRANRNQLAPPGHLSACVWQLRQLLLHQLDSLAGPAIRLLESCTVKCLAREQRHPDVGGGAATGPLAKPLDSTTRINLNGSGGGANRVTPKSVSAADAAQPASTFEQVASSLIRLNAIQPAAAGGASRRRAATGLLLRPTPLMTASAATTMAPIYPSSARAAGAPLSVGADLVTPSLPPPPLRLAHANLAFAAAASASHQPLMTRHHWAQKFGGENTALHHLSPLRSSDEYHARLMAICGRVGQLDSPAGAAAAAGQPSIEAAPATPPPANGARNIELQLERLSTKYELVRTVNARIDACFGPMLLIQFFFLFLMSCIDLVFFSLCFSASTKTKYIIISGMILLWCPYMLIYKFASDMGSSSKELLVSIRRLARLYLIEDQAVSACQTSGGRAASGSGTVIGSGCRGDGRAYHQQHHHHLLQQQLQHHLWSTSRLETTNNNSSSGGGGLANYNCRLMTLSSPFIVAQNDLAATKIGAAIVDKLDHVFKPTHLSIMGIMTVDKFFLLNFAKIVITSSVMMIQFISN